MIRSRVSGQRTRRRERPARAGGTCVPSARASRSRLQVSKQISVLKVIRNEP
jgi:hypothetical protein